jgi:hypothetical protein
VGGEPAIEKSMNERDRGSPYAPPSSPAARPDGERPIVDLAAAMIADARARVEADRVAAASRGPFTKLVLALAILAAISAGATMLYGIYTFPDAPIRPRGSGFAGKTGDVRTQADYDRYVAWSRAMFVAFPATFVLAFAFLWLDARPRSNGSR